MTKVLSRDEILSAFDKVSYEDVAVPEFGEGAVIRIRTLTALGRGIFVQRQHSNDPSHLVTNETMLVALCAVDEEGKRLFSEKDVAALGELSAAAIKRCAEVALRLSGLLPTAREEAGKGSAPTES